MTMTLCRASLILVLTTSANSQFFADFFSSFQPFATNQPTLRSIFEVTTRRPDQGKNYYRQSTKTTRQEETTKAYGQDRKNPIYPQFSIDREDDNRKRKTTVNTYTTTVKPKKKNTTRRLINNDKRTQNIQDYNYNNNNNDYDGKINAIGDYYTQRPNYNNNKPDYGGNNYYTENPFNKGVKPVVTNGPPITNKPVTRRPSYGVNPRPKDEDSISFPEDDVSPEIIIGPDEDNMSDVEKRRYIELAERKCNEYKTLGQRAVQAIPLLPSPEPVEINVGKCAPTTVPLVVGGKVVGIQEFPHMALLGWRKIQTGGYAWKCGGSLVSERFVLTAAHCSFQDRDNTVVNGPPRAVQLGSSNLDDPGALVVKVSAVIRHPKYKLPRSYYDLALVKLATSVKFSEVVKPACLGPAPAVGQAIIATGWGRTEYGGDQSQELRSVSLPVWSMPRCQEVLGTSRKLPDGPSADSQICAGEERGGKDTCQGDSGGPAQIQEGCIWRVVGVTSLGRSCGAAETPGLYAKVQRAFIASQIFASEPIRNYTTNFNNYGNNNANSGHSNTAYGTNNGNYGSNNGNSGNTNGNSWNNNTNYDNNNRQDSINTERPSNVNYNNGKPQLPQSYNQDYTQSPDRNVNYNAGGQYGGNSRDDDYYNRGRPNQQDYNTQVSNNRPTRYTTTQKPNRSDGIAFNYNNDDYNTYYTTRKPVRSNNNDNSNNYNSQNYGSSNRDQDYNRNNNYGYNNNQSTQRAQSNNYGDNRQSSQDDYTVNRPWWLT